MENIKIKFIQGGIIFSTLLLLFPTQDTSSSIVFGPVPAKNLYNVTMKKDKTGTNRYLVSDLTYEKDGITEKVDNVLSFNKPADRLLQDDTARYKIRYADYILLQNKGELGGGCAQFFRESHRVEMETTSDLWLGRCGDLDSFTIEFRFQSRALVDGSVIFSRIGHFTGGRQGVEILVRNGRVVCQFHDMFEAPDGTRKTISLLKGKQVQPDRWYHFSVSYDRISGRLAKFLNGEEEEVRYITLDGTPCNGPYTAVFGERNDDGAYTCLDSPVAVLGRSFIGLIDEFRITYTHIDDLAYRTAIALQNYKNLGVIGRLPYNTEGMITSPVYRFDNTGTGVQLFSWDSLLPEKTFIWFEFRLSDDLFYESDLKPRWYRVTRDQRNMYLMKGEDGQYLRGKFYQWRAHLIVSPDGTASPELMNVRMDIKLDTPPTIPQLLQVVETRDRSIKIKWKKNTDFDLRGYRIYYGVREGQYDGIISTVRGKDINNSLSGSNFIEIEIDNDIIDENRNGDRRRLLTYPLIRNAVLYFFAVSAYDSYKAGTPHNHESGLSSPVSARPFAGSEIK